MLDENTSNRKGPFPGGRETYLLTRSIRRAAVGHGKQQRFNRIIPPKWRIGSVRQQRRNGCWPSGAAKESSLRERWWHRATRARRKIKECGCTGSGIQAVTRSGSSGDDD